MSLAILQFTLKRVCRRICGVKRMAYSHYVYYIICLMYLYYQNRRNTYNHLSSWLTDARNL